jgi:putative peptidoglycan lipid II flippase
MRAEAAPPRADAASADVVRHSVSVAGWVAVCRISGLARVAVTAAVLGATYLGNTFQALNTLPNLAFELLAGTLFGSLLIPPLVRRVDERRGAAVETLAGGFLGVVMVGFAALTVVAVLAGPVVLRVFTFGVADQSVAAAQRHVGWLLLSLLMPQILLYGVAGIGAAVMNAHGRFSLAAAAPAVENFGVMLTLGLAAVLFGTGRKVTAVPTAEIVLLGAGTTAAVGCHAAVMWCGARRAGVVLRPRAGWRDPEVVGLMRRAASSLGYVWLNVSGYFGLLVVANPVPGGVVAFQLAMNFFHFSVAVGADPVTVAVRPQLARLYRDGRLDAFRDRLVRAGALVAFFTVPAGCGLLVLAGPLGRAVAVGAMDTGVGVRLLTGSLAALALAVVGESFFRLARDAAYARHDVRGPLVAMALRTVVSTTMMAGAYLFLSGPAVLVGLGAAFSAGTIVGAAHLIRRVARDLPPGSEPLRPSLARIAGGSVLMLTPAYLIASHPLTVGPEHAGRILAVLCAAVVGLGAFLALQRRWNSTELGELVAALRSTPAPGGP